MLLTVATFRLARRIAKDPVTAPVRAPFVRFEHQAAASGDAGYRSGNLVGFEQYRQTLSPPVHTTFDFSTLEG